MYLRTGPYSLEDYIEHRGDGNMLRGENFGQPRALAVGDELSNGWVIDRKPFEGFNGSVGLTFTNGATRLIPARLPLQLRSDAGGIYPGDLVTGRILQTGCVVLKDPEKVGPVEERGGQDEVQITITGGLDWHTIGVPSDLAVAVHAEAYPPNPDTLLGSFALEKTLRMTEAARHNLPELGQLALNFELHS